MKRLMLGTNDFPSLLVTVKDNYDPESFEFYVVNGCWKGHFTKGYISIFENPAEGDCTDISHKLIILCDSQDRLRGNYNDVFNNFKDTSYVAPMPEIVNFDDISF